MSSTLDDFLLTLGNPGRYQMFVFFVLCTTFYPTSFHINSMLFIGVTPKHHCKLPDSWLWSLNESLPEVMTSSGVMEKDNCNLYANPGNKSDGVIPCPEGWTYETTTDEWSIVREWNLVCDEEYKVSLAATLFFAGMTLGSAFVGPICDRLGRRLVILASLYAQLLISMAIAFAPNYVLFVTLRFFLGIWVQSASVSAMTLVIELFHWKYRTTAGLFTTLTFSIYLGIYTWISKQFDSWRHIVLVISLPSIATLIYFWFIPESFRWLICQRDTEEAYILVKKYIRFNAITPHPHLRQEMDSLVHSVRTKVVNEKKKCHVFGLFYTPKLRLISFINMFYWFGTWLTYFHSTYYMVYLNVNLYLSLLISALTEFAFIFLLIVAMSKIGRKTVLTATFALTGILCLATAILASVQGDTGETRMFLALLVKAVAVSSGNCLSVYTSELYPTIIRGLGIGSCSFWSRIAGIMGPQMVLLGSQMQEAIPFYTLTLCNALCAACIYLLPETRNKSMPETFEDVDYLWKTKEEERTNSNGRQALEGAEIPSVVRDISAAGDVGKEKSVETNGIVSTQL